MDGEVSRCPECGAELPAGNIHCMLCTPDRRAAWAAFSRFRKRRRLALLAATAIIASVLILWPIVGELTTPLPQKLILTAGDLGPEWWSSGPEERTYLVPEGSEAAQNRVGYDQASGYVEVNCMLTMHPAAERANSSYNEMRQNTLASGYWTGAESVAVGDRAFLCSHSLDGQDGLSWYIVMQKGRWVATIALLSFAGGEVERSQAVHLAEVQAAKLP